MPHTFPAAEKSKDSRAAEGVVSHSEELTMLTTLLFPGHSKHRPHTSPCCVLQRTGDTREGTEQLRAGLALPSVSFAPFKTNHTDTCWAEILPPCTAGGTALIAAFSWYLPSARRARLGSQTAPHRT